MTVPSSPTEAARRVFDCGCTFGIPDGWKRCDQHEIFKGQRFTCRRLHQVVR